MQSNVDGADNGDTISEGELQQHLQSLMKGNRVAEWVSHSVGLPQYVKAFRDNSITVQDFPLFVNDGGESLKNDLGIKSALHRQQLTRAMKRVILGLGTAPSAPQNLRCRQVTCSSILLTWQPPERLGHPPFHKYKLQRSEGEDSGWVSVNKNLDDEETHWEDRGLEEGVYRYRLTAWNAYGWSDDALSLECTVSLAADACTEAQSSNLYEPLHVRHARSTKATPRDAWKSKGTWAAVLAGAAFLLYLKKRRKRQSLAAAKETMEGRPMPGTPIFREGSDALADGRSGQGQLPNGVPRTLSGRSYARSDSRGSHASDGLERRRVAFAMDGHTDSGLSEQSVEAASESGRMERSPMMAGPSRMLSARHGSFGEVGSGFEEQLHALEPLRIDRQPLAFSNPQPTAFPSHTLDDTRTVAGWLGGPGDRMGRALSERQSGGAGMQDAEDYGEDVPETPAGVDPWRCGHHGCHRQFRGYKLSNVKHAMQRHFCSVCQRVFCHHHTAYSPHGPLGSCGMESQCICENCFSVLPWSTQERLKKTNKLVKKAPRAVHHSHSTGELRAEADGQAGISNQLTRDDRSPQNFAALLKSLGSAKRTSLVKGNSPSPGNGEAGSDVEPDRRDSFGSRRRQRRSAQERWSFARSAVSAALRFRRAGEERRASHDAQPEPPPPQSSS
ncbi:g1403 [Coccomyxa elongata]